MPIDLRVRNRRGGLGIAVVASIALIGPAACSAEGDAPEAPSPSPTVSASAPTPNEPPATSSAGPSASEQPTTGGAADAGAGDKQALLAAGATAEKAVSGSTLISIELESDGWEAQVVTADGVEHELTVAADGRTVTSGPTKDDEDAADRAKHRQRLADSSVDYQQAVEAVSAAVPKGKIRELDLDTWKGTVVWEADVIDGSGTKREVKVDGSSGKVVFNQIDS